MSKENGIQKSTMSENAMENVQAKIGELVSNGEINFPKNYSYQNALKGAWLVLQETQDRNKKPALQVCTKSSIINALFEMAIKALSVTKKQGYFIVYGNKLVFQESYFGHIAMLKRAVDVKTISAQVIYEDDDFEYTINSETGMKELLKHEQKLENIDFNKIRGAYAMIVEENGTEHFEAMTMKQIRASWNMGQTNGSSKAHTNFTDEMAKRTIINRLTKSIINTSDDAGLIGVDEQEQASQDKFDRVKSEMDELDPHDEVVTFDEQEEEEGNNSPQLESGEEKGDGIDMSNWQEEEFATAGQETKKRPF